LKSRDTKRRKRRRNGRSFPTTFELRFVRKNRSASARGTGTSRKESSLMRRPGNVR